MQKSATRRVRAPHLSTVAEHEPASSLPARGLASRKPIVQPSHGQDWAAEAELRTAEILGAPPRPLEGDELVAVLAHDPTHPVGSALDLVHAELHALEALAIHAPETSAEIVTFAFMGLQQRVLAIASMYRREVEGLERRIAEFETDRGAR